MCTQEACCVQAGPAARRTGQQTGVGVYQGPPLAPATSAQEDPNKGVCHTELSLWLQVVFSEEGGKGEGCRRLLWTLVQTAVACLNIQQTCSRQAHCAALSRRRGVSTTPHSAADGSLGTWWLVCTQLLLPVCTGRHAGSTSLSGAGPSSAGPAQGQSCTARGASMPAPPCARHSEWCLALPALM